jgi:hypothetical protein
VQVALVVAWCGWLTDTFSNFSLWMLVIAIVSLLFVLPWFWASLRYVALVGWLVGCRQRSSFRLAF